MGCKQNIFTVNQQSTAMPVNTNINLGGVARNYGNCITLNNDVINLKETGYYDLDVSATFTSPVAGNVTITLFQDGSAVPGATATTTITTATTQVASLCFPAIVRVRCGNTPSQLTLVLSGATATFSNVAVKVSKL